MLNIIHQILRWDYGTKVNIFFTTNMFFLAVGMSSLGIGVWLYLERNDFLELTPSSFSALSAAGLCCFTGATVCIISIVGCMGAWLHNKSLMTTYLVFVILLGLIQAITGLTGIFYKDAAKEHVRLDLLHKINRTYLMNSRGHRVELNITWDHLQESLSCCGVDGPSDWFYSRHWPLNEFVPDSCCNPLSFSGEEGTINCGKMKDDNLWFEQGCYPVFIEWLFYHILVVNWVSMVFIFIELVVLIAGFILICEISSDQRKRQKRRDSEYRMRLMQINERERNELHMQPMDRMGDASKEDE